MLQSGKVFGSDPVGIDNVLDRFEWLLKNDSRPYFVDLCHSQMVMLSFMDYVRHMRKTSYETVS